MYIGLGIVLIVIGAILAFALKVDIPGVGDDTLGYILMIVGVIGLIMTAFIWGPRRTAARGDVVEERRVYNDRV